MAKGTIYPHVKYYLNKYRPKSGRTLEIGCGAALYRDRFPQGHYIGLDVPNPYYQDDSSVDIFGRGEHLPFDDGRIDLLFSQAVIDYVEGIDQFLSESYRVLSAAGKMLVFTYSRKGLQHIHDDAKGLDVNARKHFHVYEEQELIRKIQETGFSVRQIPFVARPHLPMMPFVSGLPLVSGFLNGKTNWRNFLAWKAD